ncbi:uncharacterized protein LOC122964936 [Acropora millepora]|uniref:uncharacterized protein LOC122964936 n=1 Tax=Acropora millepora TaxID=45264 RepID=UPI001CF4148A|nr:uncharacterized protein LOC122964936 [Acropora millepora]
MTSSFSLYDKNKFEVEVVPKIGRKSRSLQKGPLNPKLGFRLKRTASSSKRRFFSIWSIFVCGVGGSKRKRVTAFVSKPNPASNLISLRCYIYSDNEDSKRKVKRFEEEHFPGSKSCIERPLKLYSDNQDIAVWLDKETLTKRGWILDGTPASQLQKLKE